MDDSLSMNNTDAVISLAQNNGKIFYPLHEEEAIEKDVPYFEIKKDSTGYCGYSMKYYNYESHDNAPRMHYYCDYLLKNVLPNVDAECNLSGFYPIELHDAITYLDNGKDYDNVFTFAKNNRDKYATLIPDPFMIGNYGGRLNIKDPLSWEQKIDKIAFFGVTTGNRNPTKNKRLQLSHWSTQNRDISDFYITGVAQMKPDDIVKSYSDKVTAMFCNPVKQEEQYKYKYLLSVDGNTCSYDRLCWIMKSNSLLFKYPSNDVLWYYPLILENTHFVEAKEESFHKKLTFYQNNPNEARHIIKNANEFASNFTTPVNAILYTTFLFETIADNK